MIHATRSRQERPKAPRIVLAVLCAVAVVALSQCKMTADKVTGVEATMNQGKPQSDNHGQCISNCQHVANDAQKAENDLHKANEKACQGNPACLAAEDARHNAALNLIEEDRQRCMDGCHHQGGGHGH